MEDTTESRLWTALQLHVHRWFQNLQFELHPMRNNALNAATASQNCIGWTNFMQGRLSHKFILHQRRFYLDQEKMDTDTLALDWGVLFLTSLFKILDMIWTWRCHKLHGEDVFVDPKEK